MKEELIGFKELRSETLKCGDCGAKLVEIVLMEDNESREKRGLLPQKSSYRVTKCFKCKTGSSFTSSVFEGSVSVGATKEGVSMDIEDTEEVADVIHIRLTTDYIRRFN